MQIETLGDAFAHSAKVWIACAWGPVTHGYQRKRECKYRYTLDLETLLITRGRGFPAARLAERVRCPRCGSRDMRVIWEYPPVTGANSARAG